MDNQQIEYKERSTYASRKFLLTIFSIILITLVSFASVWAPTIPAIFPTFIGGILGVLSLYMTGNIMNKYVVNKTANQEEEK